MKNRGWEIPLCVKHVWSFLRVARNHNGYSIISENQLPNEDHAFPTQMGRIHYLNINHTGVRRRFVHPSPTFYGEENKAPKRLQKTQRFLQSHLRRETPEPREPTLFSISPCTVLKSFSNQRVHLIIEGFIYQQHFQKTKNRNKEFMYTHLP